MRRPSTDWSMVWRALAFAGVLFSIMMVLWVSRAAHAAEGVVTTPVWIDALPRWTTAGLALGSLALVVLTLYLSTRFASKADVVTMSAKVDEIDRRTERLEAEVDAMPTKDDVHKIAIDVAAIAATLGPMANRVERIDTYLLEKKKD